MYPYFRIYQTQYTHTTLVPTCHVGDRQEGSKLNGERLSMYHPHEKLRELPPSITHPSTTNHEWHKLMRLLSFAHKKARALFSLLSSPHLNAHNSRYTVVVVVVVLN
jgi:hypothetical protein